jgi:hypothetical protein
MIILVGTRKYDSFVGLLVCSFVCSLLLVRSSTSIQSNQGTTVTNTKMCTTSAAHRSNEIESGDVTVSECKWSNRIVDLCRVRSLSPEVVLRNVEILPTVRNATYLH